jgi:TATA-box binding protein (TBP) (component of TFIID and TFIIIB)
VDIQSDFMSEMQPDQCNDQSVKEWTVVNATYSGRFNKPLPRLDKLMDICKFDYNPRRHNAGFVRTSDGTILLYDSGSFIVVGVRCYKIARRVVRRLQYDLKKVGLTRSLCSLYLCNYVIWFRPSPDIISLLNNAILGHDKTKHIVKDAVEKVEGLTYIQEPETFPSFRFFVRKPKATVCVFIKSGTAIITGIRDLSVVDCVISTVESIK